MSSVNYPSFPLDDEKQPLHNVDQLPPPVQACNGPDACPCKATRRERRRKRARRFFHFLSLIGLFFLFSRYFSRKCQGSDNLPTLLSKTPSSWVDMDHNCTRGSDGWASVKQTESSQVMVHNRFSLPLDSFAHFFESTVGPSARGAISFQVSRDVMHADADKAPMATVDVFGVYEGLSALDAISVCKVQSGNEDGLVIAWQPNADSPIIKRADMALINVIVKLPSSMTDIPEIKTNLPRFAHAFARGVQLGNVHLQAADEPILSKGLSAQAFEAHTSNAPIRGDYNVSTSLVLKTSNALIDVNVEAYHYPHWHRPTTIRLTTSNAPLDAVLALHNTTRVGRFRAISKTSNAAINVTIAESPVAGVLFVDTKTSNAPALLALDAAFEGYFGVGTSNAAPALERREGVEDPTGQGRERVVETSYVSKEVIGGSTAWGALPGGKHLKSIAGVGTSNKEATLVL